MRNNTKSHQPPQLSKSPSLQRKNSTGKIHSTRVLNQDLIDVTTDRYAIRKQSDPQQFSTIQQHNSNFDNNEIQEPQIIHPHSILKVANDDAQGFKSSPTNEKLSAVSPNVEQVQTVAPVEQTQSKEDVHENLDVAEVIQEKDQVAVSDSKEPKLLYYVYGGNYPETVVNALQARGNWSEAKEDDNIEKCNFLWRPFNYPIDVYKRIDKRLVRNNQIFIYNHFEVLKGLTTKSGLVRSLKQYYYSNDQARAAGYSIFDSTPTTFLLASGVDDAEQNEMVQRYKDFQRGFAPKERIPIKHCVNNIWLVKPSNANQGKGIEIFSDIEDLVEFVNSRPQYTCCVVQKYIERPLLFKGRKFDIRLWALFTSRNEVFMYKDGYLRTSSDDYNLTNGNNYVHLTNNCLQKYGNNYGVHEDGNTVGFDVLQQYLDEMFPNYKVSVKEHFIPRMKDLIIDSFLATKNQLNPNRRKHCFELLGYDFLIDEDFRLWMIEINTNPYFGVPNAFIAGLLPKMMDDLLDIVLDPIYPPIHKPQNCNLPNDFDLLYCEGNSPYSANPVNQRRPFNTSLYPIPELAQQVGAKAPRVKFLSFLTYIQQDLKYLRQFKIQNLTLSTVTYKHQKDPKGTQANSATTTPLFSKDKRSKSLAGSKTTMNCSQYLQAQMASNQSIVREKQSRSRSTYKPQSIVKQNNLTTTSHPQQQQQTQVNQSVSVSSRKGLFLQPTITFANKSQRQNDQQQSVSKTPKIYNNKKHSSILKVKEHTKSPFTLSATHTEKVTPRQNTQITSSLSKIDNSKVSIRNQSRSDQLLNKPETKYSVDIWDIQDKLTQRKGQQRDTSKQRDLGDEDFGKFFDSALQKIQKGEGDIAKNVEVLQQLFSNNKVGRKHQEAFVFRIVESLSTMKNLEIQYSLIDLIVKLSDKLQHKQSLAKTQTLELLVDLYVNGQIHMQNKVEKVLQNIASLPSKIPQSPQIISPKVQSSSRESEGVTIVKRTLLKKCLESGIFSMLMVTNQNLQSQMIDTLSLKELETVLAQLKPLYNKSHNMPFSQRTSVLQEVQQRQSITEPDQMLTEVALPCVTTELEQTQQSPLKTTTQLQTLTDTSFEVVRIQRLDQYINTEAHQDSKNSSPSQKKSSLVMHNAILNKAQVYVQSFELSTVINKVEEAIKAKAELSLVVQSTPKKLRTETSVNSRVSKDQTPSTTLKIKVYDSPFKRSIKPSPTVKEQTPKEGLNSYETPDKNPVEKTPKHNQLRTSMGLSRFLQPKTKQVNQNHVPVNFSSQSHLQTLTDDQQPMLTQSSMGGTSKKKYFAPILRNKQSLIQTGNTASSKISSLAKAQDIYLEQPDHKQLKPDKRLIQSAKQSKSIAKINNLKKNGTISKMHQSGVYFYDQDKDTMQRKSDLTLDQINRKIIDIQSNLNIMSQYSAAHKERLRKGSGKKSNSGSFIKKQGQEDQKLSQSFQSANNTQKGHNNREEIDDYNYQSNLTEDGPNKNIMPFEVTKKIVVTSEKHHTQPHQYYKRGSQVSQVRQSSAKYSRATTINSQVQCEYQSSTADLHHMHPMNTVARNSRKSSLVDLSQSQNKQYQQDKRRSQSKGSKGSFAINV